MAGEIDDAGAGAPIMRTSGDAASPASDDILAAAQRLRCIVKQVTTEEFRWQDSHYDRDSRFGRELLFLIANNEWARATSETVNITRSDAVDTSIKIDVDLEQITHEAFRNGANQLWLPLLVLPAPKRGAHAERQPEVDHEHKACRPARAWMSGLFSAVSGLFKQPLRQTGEADPFATLTVTGAAGDLLAMLPNADVRHRISAAMAEIIVNMAAVRWPGPENERPAADRDQRLVLSAAIYRLLRSGPCESPASYDISAGRDANPAAGNGRLASSAESDRGHAGAASAAGLPDTSALSWPADPATSAALRFPPGPGGSMRPRRRCTSCSPTTSTATSATLPPAS